MTDAPDRIWVWQREKRVMDGNSVNVSLERNWAETMLPDVADVLGATIFVRADLAPTDAHVMAHPKVRALVEDAKAQLDALDAYMKGRDGVRGEHLALASLRADRALRAALRDLT